MNASVIAGSRERNWVVGLIGIGHFYSHFVMLCLAPVFPFIRDDLGASYVAVGGVMAAFNATTGVGQIPIGFLVDRFGGRRMLIAGIALMGACLALVGATTAYWQLAALFAVAGIGNSVFHPADYAILNARVGQDYFGRAVSVHGFAGYMGWTAAPPIMLGLVAVADWRIAITLVGIAGLAIAGVMALRGGLLDDRSMSVERSGRALRQQASFADGMRLMRSPPMTMMFLFFALTGAATVGLMAFSAVALVALDGVGLVFANSALTGHLFASACGVLVGGWLADRTARHNLVTSAAIVAMAVAVALLAFSGVPAALLVLLMTASGLFYGISSPSRDVIVREVTPPGSMGVAFGFTATGLSFGTATGPIVFGWLMDMNRPSLMFLAVAAAIAVSVAAVMLTRPDGGAARTSVSVAREDR